MKPIKLMDREYSTPILGGGVLPVMNHTAELGLPTATLIIVSVVSCFYAAIRVWQKVQEMKYANRCGSCGKEVEKIPAPTAQ